MHDRTVSTLNALLNGERSAAKCYQRVLRRVPEAADGRAEMQECLESHHRRAARLAVEVSSRGGASSVRVGFWGRMFALLTSMLATAAFRLARRLLQSVEIHGIRRYDRSWERLDGSARYLLTTSLFPEQVLSHQAIALLNDSHGGLARTTTS